MSIDLHRITKSGSMTRMLGANGAWPLIVWLMGTAACWGADKAPAFGPPPSWVRVISDPPPARAATNQANEGIAFALLDEQVNVATAETYVRVVKDLISEAGVQNGAQLSFSFDPSYQDLAIHHISVVRGPQTLNRLEREKIRVIQRERSLELNIYDGRLTAALFLEDVRVGDRIDYSFTIRGFNPILEGRYAGSFSPQWSTPVQRNRFRLLWPTHRTLSIRDHGGQFQPKITEADGTREYVWDLAGVEPVEVEDSLPSWYDACPWVQFSEFASWREVNQWALSLYSPKPTLPPELKARISEWQSQHVSPEDRLLAAVQFVQDEIRYLGFEFGAGSHRPSSPAEVFTRRFGDCKDKTFLLCAILDELGFRSWPLLVHTSYRQAVSDWLPSPYAFNHVIAEIETPDGTVLVDPTRSNQEGPVSSRFVPDYVLGLPIRADTWMLTSLPRRGAGAPLLSTREVFEVKGKTEPAQFTVYTIAFGAEADRLRATLRDSTAEDLQKGYLNFYARQYSGISVRAPIQIKDPTRLKQASTRTISTKASTLPRPGAGVNQVEITESYEIKDFWTLSDDKAEYVCEFYPLSIEGLISRPDIRLRKMPLGYRYPHHEIHRTEVNLPEPWTVEAESKTIDSPAFQFSAKRSSFGRQVILEYEYTALTNSVAAAQVPAHLQALDQMEQALGYNLTWQNQSGAWALQNVNWTILALTVVYCCLLALGATFIYRYDPETQARPPPIPAEPGATPQGLGGWLFLVGLGVVLTPFLTLGALIQGYWAYASPHWHAVTSPSGKAYHALYGPLLTFELLGNLTIVVFSIVLATLYFQKRTTFPRLFIIYLVGFAAFLCIDNAGASRIPDLAGQSTMKEPIQGVVRCLIWIPYMLHSRRVRATFVNRRHRAVSNLPPASPPAESPPEPDPSEANVAA